MNSSGGYSSWTIVVGEWPFMQGPWVEPPIDAQGMNLSVTVSDEQPSSGN